MDRATAVAKLAELRPSGFADGIRTQGTGTTPGGTVVDPRPTFGLGLSAGAHADDYRIAIRVQDKKLLGGARVASVVEAAGGEADVEFVGLLKPFISGSATASPTQRARPLVPGASISLATATGAGTLGCFVRDADATYLLSNSHVLTSHGTAALQASVLQPATYDGGNATADHVATVTRAVAMDLTQLNLADCAIAEINTGSTAVRTEIPGVGQPSTSSLHADLGMRVVKRGRTSNVTLGAVTGISLNLKFAWPQGAMELVDLIEITADNGAADFAAPGDSGALILSEIDLRPVALLIGGGPASNGLVKVYATPIATVLGELDVSLL